jgi:hypothetical protein
MTWFQPMNYNQLGVFWLHQPAVVLTVSCCGKNHSFKRKRRRKLRSNFRRSGVSLKFCECIYDRKLTICEQKVHLWWLEIDITIGNLKITNYICIVWQQIDNLRTKSASLVVGNWHFYRKSEKKHYYICIVWQQIDNLRTKSASLVVGYYG